MRTCHATARGIEHIVIEMFASAYSHGHGILSAMDAVSKRETADSSRSRRARHARAESAGAGQAIRTRFPQHRDRESEAAHPQTEAHAVRPALGEVRCVTSNNSSCGWKIWKPTRPPPSRCRIATSHGRVEHRGSAQARAPPNCRLSCRARPKRSRPSRTLVPIAVARCAGLARMFRKCSNTFRRASKSFARCGRS